MIDKYGREEARQYFKDKGFTYQDITSGDICTLTMLLNKHIKKACKDHKMSVDSMRMSEKIQSKYSTNGRLIECYLFMNREYTRMMIMDNEYTRKEKECPLVAGFCNQEHKNCSICIAEEEAWQEEQCIRECRAINDY